MINSVLGNRRLPAPPCRRPGRQRRSRGHRRALGLFAFVAVLLVVPAPVASAVPNPFDVSCFPNEPPTPAVAGTGSDAMLSPGSEPDGDGAKRTTYDNYGMAGQKWHTINLACSDIGSFVENWFANLGFDFAKMLARATLSTLEAAYRDDLLEKVSAFADNTATSLGQHLRATYLTPFILLGALWLMWQGLLRRRATMSTEGTVWMVFAIVALTWLMNRPQDITGAGRAVVHESTSAMMTAVTKPLQQSLAYCFDEKSGDLGSSEDVYVREATNALWSVLVCKPWLAGQFGAPSFLTGVRRTDDSRASQDVMERYGKDLLWAQAFTVDEMRQIHANGAFNRARQEELLNAKRQKWEEIHNAVRRDYPALYPIFQGKDGEVRVGVALAALLAAVFVGFMVLLMSLALIVLQIGVLLLVMTGPLFLLIGVHPGIGRVVAMRWFELLIGTFLKQILVALVLTLFLLGVALITSPTVGLPWMLQTTLIGLMAIAALIYRKPFTHLFTSLGPDTFATRAVAQTTHHVEPVSAGTKAVGSKMASYLAIASLVRRRTGVPGGATAVGSEHVSQGAGGRVPAQPVRGSAAGRPANAAVSGAVADFVAANGSTPTRAPSTQLPSVRTAGATGRGGDPPRLWLPGRGQSANSAIRAELDRPRSGSPPPLRGGSTTPVSRGPKRSQSDSGGSGGSEDSRGRPKPGKPEVWLPPSTDRKKPQR